MLNAARTALLGAALAALLIPGSFAQDKKSNSQSKETLWVMTYSGGGGWSAAAKANKVREALAKVSGISAVEVDSAATAWMRTEGNKQPSKKVLEKAIGRRVTNLEKVVRPVPAAVYVITLEGMAWGKTCIEAREVLQELPNVIAALPFGDTHKVKVLTSKPKSFDKKAAIAILDGTDYELVGFTYKALGTAKTKLKKGE